MKDLTVLITAAGNVYMPGTIACLRKNGERKVRIIGVDMNADDTILQMCDVTYQVPKANDPEYIDALLNICSKEKVDVLLPIMSAELEKLAEHKKRFEEMGTMVSVSDVDSLAIANDKLKLLDFISEKGLPCADYSCVNSIEEFNNVAEKLGYPEKKICVKAIKGSGSRGFRIIDESVSQLGLFLNDKPTSERISLKDMNKTLCEAEVFPKLLLMEYLPGNEYSVDLLADKGKVLYSCCRKSLRMENSIMLEAEIVDNPEALSLCNDITALLGLDGNIGFDIKERYDGVPMIMECNPRITAGVPFFERAGVNLPYLCIKKLLGEELPSVEPEYGKIVRRRWTEMAN